MATTKFTLSGKVFFPKLFKENADKKFDPDGAYVLSVKVDDTLADQWEKTGSMSKVKFDRKTKENLITVRRKHANKNDWAGGPPRVLNADGSARTYADGIIWNDSIVEADVVIYDTSKGKGTRLEEVRIISLASPPDQEEEGEGTTATIINPPKTTATTNSKTKYDEEIPF